MIRLILVCILLIGCASKGEDAMSKKPDYSNLEDQVILFGHQSIGANILDGIKYIAPNQQIVDFYIGENRDPISKIEAFEKIIRTNKQNNRHIDIAMMKLCFVDMTDPDIIDRIFFKYFSTIQDLEMDYPDIRFIHITVPLTTDNLPTVSKQYMKNLIKGIIGRGNTYNKLANEYRNRYNEKIRSEFDKSSVFDLAAIESNGLTYKEHGAPALLPAYTNDGGHLNFQGKKEVGEHLLTFLNEE